MSGESNFILKGSSVDRTAVEFDLQSCYSPTLFLSQTSVIMVVCNLNLVRCWTMKQWEVLLIYSFFTTSSNMAIMFLGILWAALSYWQYLPVYFYSCFLSCSLSGYTCRCLWMISSWWPAWRTSLRTPVSLYLRPSVASISASALGKRMSSFLSSENHSWGARWQTGQAWGGIQLSGKILTEISFG